jgi:hypothetical protein
MKEGRKDERTGGNHIIEAIRWPGGLCACFYARLYLHFFHTTTTNNSNDDDTPSRSGITPQEYTAGTSVQQNITSHEMMMMMSEREKGNDIKERERER